MTSTPEDHSSPPFCAPNPPNLVGSLFPDLVARSWEELLQLFPQVQHGGQYKPPDCRSRDRVAVVVPYRDRELHLRVLLHSLHPILQRQQQQYRIILSEPELPTTFNRGLAMNVGFREALKLDNFTCFIFHDVDLYPENDRIPYTCSKSPVHLSVAMDKFRYHLPYLSYFGGVLALSRELYEKINGFSNVFFGWGGEDDDLYNRVISAGMKISRPPIAVARYRMYWHSRDKTNPSNTKAFRMLGTSSRRMSWDGLSNLNASIVKVEEHPLYTHVLFRADKDTLLKEFEQREHGGR